MCSPFWSVPRSMQKGCQPTQGFTLEGASPGSAGFGDGDRGTRKNVQTDQASTNMRIIPTRKDWCFFIYASIRTSALARPERIASEGPGGVVPRVEPGCAAFSQHGVTVRGQKGEIGLRARAGFQAHRVVTGGGGALGTEADAGRIDGVVASYARRYSYSEEKRRFNPLEGPKARRRS
jgi:hypothetical protein